jgi:hypothetical protein
MKIIEHTLADSLLCVYNLVKTSSSACPVPLTGEAGAKRRRGSVKRRV